MQPPNYGGYGASYDLATMFMPVSQIDSLAMVAAQKTTVPQFTETQPRLAAFDSGVAPLDPYKINIEVWDWPIHEFEDLQPVEMNLADDMVLPPQIANDPRLVEEEKFNWLPWLALGAFAYLATRKR